MKYQCNITGWAHRLNTKMDYYTFYADGTITLHEFSRNYKDKVQSKIVSINEHPADCGVMVPPLDIPVSQGKR